MNCLARLLLCSSISLGSACGLGIVQDEAYDAESAELELKPRKADTYTIVTPRGDTADVYYPRGKSKHHGKGAQDGYPVVALLQGARVDKSQYASFATRVAGYGFVVVVPNHFSSLIPGRPPELFTNQLVIHDVMAAMRREAADPASPVYDRVDTSRLGVTGHSFGGVAGLFAAAGSCSPPFCFGVFPPLPELGAVAVYGSHLVNGGRSMPIDTSNTPVALLEGMLDNPAEVTQTYEELELPRALMLFEGLNHFGITDVNNPPGAQPDPEEPTVEQDKGTSRIAKWTALFLRAHLLNDSKALRAVYECGGDKKGHVSVIADR